MNNKDKLMQQLLLNLTSIVLELKRQPSLQLTTKELKMDYATLLNTLEELGEL